MGDGIRAAVYRHFQRVSTFPRLGLVDKKWSWFYLFREGHRYPHTRKALDQSQIIKVVFLAAFAGPRHNLAMNTVFDGKIGLWPFVEECAAQRNSRNRAAGTLERECVEVAKATYKENFLTDVVLAIKEKWPA